MTFQYLITNFLSFKAFRAADVITGDDKNTDVTTSTSTFGEGALGAKHLSLLLGIVFEIAILNGWTRMTNKVLFSESVVVKRVYTCFLKTTH